MSGAFFNDIAYNDHLKAEQLMGSRCRHCGTRYVPPRSLCVQCHQTDMQWEQAKGTGRLVAFTCIAIAPPWMMAQGFGRNNPYISGVIELDDGGRVDARILGLDPLTPERIRLGLPMKAAYIHCMDGDRLQTVLAFSPA